jgi:hypothetical protein
MPNQLAVLSPPAAKASDKATQPAKAAVPLVHFTKVAREHTEDVFDSAKLITAAQQNLGTFEIPAFGFLRSLVLKVDATGGTGTVAVMQPDAPFNAIASLEIDDTNGQPFYGPVSGYDAYLIHKWLSPIPNDPKASPSYVAPSTAGNFSFLLRLPIEITPRDALGAMSNLNSAATYKVKVAIADSASIYSTVPTTLPTLRVRCWAEEWTEPLSTDQMGNPAEQAPPALGVTQEFSTQDIAVNAGSFNPRLTRMGNTIRAWLFKTVDNTGARTDAIWPDPVNVQFDTRSLMNLHRDLLVQYMAERYPKTYTRDTGVYLLDFAHDFDGEVGDELRDQWLQTTTGSRVELLGANWGAGTLHVITNDVLSFAGQVQ